MSLTKRDVTILRDLALSHALTRDQFIRLGYFGSITRANARLRELMKNGLISRLQTPFFNQSIYSVTKRAADVVGGRIAPLIQNRASSPRFLQHALTTTESRIALQSKFGGDWRFEQQLWRKLDAGSGREIRPDGMVVASAAVFVEVDLGHVSPGKFRDKLLGYQELALSGRCQDLYGLADFRLLTLTTGKTRARHLDRLTPQPAGFEHRIHTFADLGVAMTNSWS